MKTSQRLLTLLFSSMQAKLSMSKQKQILYGFPYSQKPNQKLTLNKPGHKMNNIAVKPWLKVPGAAFYCLVSLYCPTTQDNSFSLTNIHCEEKEVVKEETDTD